MNSKIGLIIEIDRFPGTHNIYEFIDLKPDTYLS